MLQVQNEGARRVKRNIKYYNQKMPLAVEYRVRSHVGNQVKYRKNLQIKRQWLNMSNKQSKGEPP
ncbi:MAG: virulence RhuM family protein [Syntrophomonadaceae bacterium]|nr:virulence RhuM family protein [Syntrophomonadaceae bacterium]